MEEEIPAAYQNEAAEEAAEVMTQEIQSEPEAPEEPEPADIEEEDSYQGADWQEELKKEVHPEHTAEVQEAEKPDVEISNIPEKKSEIF